jgi:YggT family protein
MEQDFIFGHLPFWIVMYVLALTAWACLGRFMMQIMVPHDSPNYIWRGFRLLTDWAVWCARRMMPSYVDGRFLPLVAACWLFGIRLVLGVLLVGIGLAPRITPPGGG